MNKEQYELIKKSVKEFNEYRKSNPDIIIDLRYADLRDANLEDADLRSADLDFAYLYFGCKSFDFKADKNLYYRILYHLCRIKFDDKDVVKHRNTLVEHANKWEGINRHELPLILLNDEEIKE